MALENINTAGTTGSVGHQPLAETEAAARLGLKVATLRAWRSQGRGPARAPRAFIQKKGGASLPPVPVSRTRGRITCRLLRTTMRAVSDDRSCELPCGRYVTLRGGLTVPEAAVLLLDLERRGTSVTRDGGSLVIRPFSQLTADMSALARWKSHALALLDYRASEVPQ